MSQRSKLIESIRNNPKDVRYEDACKAAEMLGFTHIGGSGSHRVYSKPGQQMSLNFQNRNGKIKPYQAKQLLDMIDEYWEQAND